MIRRALGFWWRATALHAATRCVMCRKRGGGSSGLTPSPFGPTCEDHFTPETVAEFKAAARERTGQVTDPRTPRNTTHAFRDDPAEALLILADGMATGSPAGLIERQEADGQRQLVNSDVIPTNGPDAELEALGFTLGPVVDGDPMFRQATLPDGWTREGSDHAMWSYIVDALGRRRCSIFYKAAFYDRSAFIRVNTVEGYVSECLYDGTTPTLDDQWATKDAVLAAITESRQYSAEQVTFWTEHGNAEYADENREKVSRCDELKARIEAS